MKNNKNRKKKPQKHGKIFAEYKAINATENLHKEP